MSIGARTVRSGRWETSRRTLTDIDPSTKRFQKTGLCPVRQELPASRFMTEFTYEFGYFSARAVMI